VIAVLGSGTAQAVGQEAQRLKVPLLALSLDPKLPVGGYVFRNFLTPRSQVERLAQFAKDQGWTNLGLFYPQDGYGKEMASLMRRAASKAGLSVVSEAAYDPKQSNVAEALQRFKEQAKGKTIQAVFVPEGSARAAIVVAQFPYAGLRGVKFLGPNLWDDPRFAAGLRDSSEEVYFVEGFFGGQTSLAVQDFVASYRRLFGEDPSYLAAQGYDDAWLIGRALEGGATSREALARALAGTKDFEGVTGLTTMRQGGEAAKSLVVLTLRGGEVTPAQ
jgi:branched-chain amino acid transport system substrate-binding protein